MVPSSGRSRPSDTAGTASTTEPARSRTAPRAASTTAAGSVESTPVAARPVRLIRLGAPPPSGILATRRVLVPAPRPISTARPPGGAEPAITRANGRRVSGPASRLAGPRAMSRAVSPVASTATEAASDATPGRPDGTATLAPTRADPGCQLSVTGPTVTTTAEPTAVTLRVAAVPSSGEAASASRDRPCAAMAGARAARAAAGSWPKVDRAAGSNRAGLPVRRPRASPSRATTRPAISSTAAGSPTGSRSATVSSRAGRAFSAAPATAEAPSPGPAGRIGMSTPPSGCTDRVTPIVPSARGPTPNWIAPIPVTVRPRVRSGRGPPPAGSRLSPALPASTSRPTLPPAVNSVPSTRAASTSRPPAVAARRVRPGAMGRTPGVLLPPPATMSRTASSSAGTVAARVPPEGARERSQPPGSASSPAGSRSGRAGGGSPGSLPGGRAGAGPSRPRASATASMSAPVAALPPTAVVSRVRRAASAAVSRATGTMLSSAAAIAAGSGAGHRVRSDVPDGAAVRTRTVNGPAPGPPPVPRARCRSWH